MDKLEKMAEFFDSRLDFYDSHQLLAIEGAAEFYPFTARCLPPEPGARVLDLGCGTGLELEEYFILNPGARVTGIDLAPGMLKMLESKFPGRELTLINGSYFDVPLGRGVFDAAVSVESLHHFTMEEKIPLYEKVFAALKDGGRFILTDYFAMSDSEERRHRQRLLELRKARGAAPGELYHFDTPLTAEHEMEALRRAGFPCPEILRRWGRTCTLSASRPGRGSV